MSHPVTHDEGIYYRRRDYAGFWRRLFVSTVDAVVALAGLLGLMLIGNTMMPGNGMALAFVIWLILFYWYFVIAKRSRARTLGYRLGRVKIVGIQGDSPTTARLTFRLVFAMIGAYSTGWGVFDLLWITGDDHRQALRDKLAHTYVVKASATPAGRGPVVYDLHHVLAWTLLLPEVRRAENNELPVA